VSFGFDVGDIVNEFGSYDAGADEVTIGTDDVIFINGFEME